MREDVLNRRRTILEAVAVVEERSPQTVKEHMDKVEARMRELLDTATVDEQRLLTEAALFADKIAVAEETVRLQQPSGSTGAYAGQRRAGGTEAGFSGAGDQPGGEHHRFQVQDVQLARLWWISRRN